MIKKITTGYQYIYFRLLLFCRKQWIGNKQMGSLNSNAAISASAFALIYSTLLIYKKFSGTDNSFINSSAIIIVIAISVVLIQTLIFSGDDEKLIEKFSDQKETDPFWKIKGVLSLIFIYGPFILLIILM